MVYKMRWGASVKVQQGSDWMDVVEDFVHVLEGLIDERLFSPIMTICLATKYSWWTMNHHVGQGSWSPYVQNKTTKL
jgi:hypothetical protein